MKKFNISSRGWIMVALAGLVLMFGAVKVVRDQQVQPVAATGENGEVPLNTLGDEPLPPMPSETPLIGIGTDPVPGTRPGTSSGGEPPLELPLPPDNPPPANGVKTPAAVAADRQPVVWVSEEGASAHAEPGFNMPKVRELKKWEELKVVEATSEAWDRMADENGNQFWVQKKVVTPIKPANLTQPSVAEEKVMAFYTQVESGAHNDAYNLLSPDWKRELSYDNFVDGYARTDSLRTEITNVFELGEDRYQVDVSMEAVEEGEPIDYLGIYTVEKVDGKWCLTTGSMKRQVRAI